MDFNTLFKIFMRIYYVDIDSFAKKLDRHPSRVYHWMSDSRPGKKIFHELLEAVSELVLENDMDHYEKFYNETSADYENLIDNNIEISTLDEASEYIKDIFEAFYRMKRINNTDEMIRLYREKFESNGYFELDTEISKYLKNNKNKLLARQLFELNIIHGKTKSLIAFINKDAAYAEEALSVLKKSIKVYSSPDAKIKFEYFRVLGFYYGILGNWHDKYSSTKSGLEYSRKAYELYNDRCDLEQYVRLLTNMAAFYNQLSCYEKPITCTNSILILIDEIKLIFRNFEHEEMLYRHYTVVMNTYSNLMHYNCNETYFKKASEYFNEIKLLEIGQARGDYVSVFLDFFANINAYYGRFTFSSEAIEKALIYYERCKNIFDKEHTQNQLVLNQINEAEATIGLMVMKNDLDYYKKAISLLDNVSGAVNESAFSFKHNYYLIQFNLNVEYLLFIGKQDLELLQKCKELQESIDLELLNTKERFNYYGYAVMFRLCEAVLLRQDLSIVFRVCDAYIDEISTSEYLVDICIMNNLQSNICELIYISSDEQEFALKSEVYAETAELVVSKSVSLGISKYVSNLMKRIKTHIETRSCICEN